jgi:MFS superfamily sulfate permease-like transporter
MSTSVPAPADVPRGNLSGFTKYMRNDLVSGFLVFLIALPLCLGISLASGYPAIAGVFTAIVGSVLTTLLSNSELTIKGPAAGLIVIVVGAVTSFGHTGGQDPAADLQAYKMALAVGVVAGVMQIAFGLVRAGVLGDFFPTAAVHGMLAAIGVIIMLKQIPIAVGQTAKGEPLEILRQIPDKLVHANPEIAVIGLTSLLILFGLPLLKKRIKSKLFQVIPAQMVVLLVAVPLGMYFDLSHEHTYTWGQQTFQLGSQFLVDVPANLLGAIAHPDFSVFTNPEFRGAAIKWVIMFALIGSLESMLSAKAIDMIDPWRRKTNLNRDLFAVGVANTVVAFVGGLPMISEIVRSKANIDNGARTRFADLWHGVFLLGFVALVPGLIHRIPLAALAAMLVYTGFRLASPREFINVFKIGPEQFIIFTTTVIAVLATDLLVGIAIGIAVKACIHLMNGLPLSSIVKPYLEVTPQGDDTVVITARGSAVFTNWIPFKRVIEHIGLSERNNVVVDLSGTRLVDHSVMEKLEEMEQEFEFAGLHFQVIGLEGHTRMSAHPHAARKKTGPGLRRLSIVAPRLDERRLLQRLGEFECIRCTALDCRGVGREAPEAYGDGDACTWITIIAYPTACQQMLSFLRTEIAAGREYVVTVDPVDMLPSLPPLRALTVRSEEQDEVVPLRNGRHAPAPR